MIALTPRCLRWLATSLALTLTLTGCARPVPQATPAPSPIKGERAVERVQEPKTEAAPAATKPVARAEKPSTVAELATYMGADRQQLLEAGARQEGKMLLYTSGILTQAVRPLIDAFTAKYPFVKVDVFRADNQELVQRITQEYQAGRYDFDVIETTVEAVQILKETGRLQAFKSPEFAAYPKDALDADGFFAPVRESYVGMGYNTQLISREEAPKTVDDLLDPKWRGKMWVAGSGTGIRFVGNVVTTKGEEFLQKLREQRIRTQEISGRALADLVISGEVPLSPTIFDSHAFNSKKQGAPIDWLPLEPTTVNLGVVALAQRSPHPHAALLFIDFALSETGQNIYVGSEYGSARQGMQGTNKNFKKLYLENVVKDYVAAYEKWEKLFKSTFVQS